MDAQILKPMNFEEIDGFDDIMTFKVKSEEKREFQEITGRKGAEYLRQAMRQIVEQIKTRRASNGPS